MRLKETSKLMSTLSMYLVHDISKINFPQLKRVREIYRSVRFYLEFFTNFFYFNLLMNTILLSVTIPQ